MIIELHKVLQKDKYNAIPLNEKIFISKEVGYETIKMMGDANKGNQNNTSFANHFKDVKEQILAAFMIDENVENKGVKLSADLNLIKDLENEIKDTIIKEVKEIADSKDFSIDKGAKEKAYQKILSILEPYMPEEKVTASSLFEKIKKEIMVPTNRLNTHFQTIGGMWTVNTWVKGDLRVQEMDEGYTHVVSKIDNNGMPQWSVTDRAYHKMKFENIKEEEFLEYFNAKKKSLKI